MADTQPIRDPFRLFEQHGKIAPSMGHDFGPNLVCRCGMGWGDHQRTRLVCPLRFAEVGAWIEDPVKADLETWARREHSLICEQRAVLTRREQHLQAWENRLQIEYEQFRALKRRKSSGPDRTGYTV